MKVRALFREYDYPLNTVSGLQGSPVLAGTGTHFTELKENTLIDIEDYGFAGKILSVQNDTSLTLDRPLNENIDDKIYWQDWSAYLVALSPSSRKTESKQPGKAGVQVYDNMSLGFLSFPTIRVGGVDIDNPVTAAFQLDLDNRNRYLIRLQALRRGLKQVPIITSTYQQLIDNLGNYLSANIRQDEVETVFEGMVDFETIDEPVLIDSQGESIATISFDVMDKLSALSNLDNQVKQRGNILDTSARLGVGYNTGIGITKMAGTEVGTIYALPTWKVEWSGNQAVRGVAVEHPETILKKGETFTHPDLENKKDKVYFVIDCGFINVNGVSTTWIKISGADEIQYNPANWYQFIPRLNYYPATYYGLSDICNYAVDSYGRMVVKSFNSALIIKAMLNAFWGDIGDNLVNGASIPLDYFEQLIDAEPFSQAPYEALQYLVDSNNSYFFIDRIGKAVLQKRKDFASIPHENDKSIPILDIDECSKKHVWDKLVDCVEINVRSWIKDDDGKYIDGLGKAYMGSEIEPRNPLTKDVFIDETTLSDYGMYVDVNGKLVDPSLPGATQFDILNHYAEIIAGEYLLFYGRRHFSYDLKLQTIAWDMLLWDLTSTFTLNNKRFFVTSLEFDFAEGACTLQLVSIDGYVYNKANVVISKNPDTAVKNSVSKSYNNYGDKSVVVSPYWSGSSKGLDPELARKSLQLYIRTCEITPIGTLTPLFVGEEIVNELKVWFKSTGTTDEDWKQLSVSYKIYTDSADPNNHVTPDYAGEWCLVTYGGLSTWWKCKTTDNDSWVVFIDQRSATAANDFLIGEETAVGSGIFHFIKKTIAQVRAILGLTTTATTSNNIVTFTNTAGGLKDSGKSITSFPDKVPDTTPDNFVAFSGTSGAQKDSGKRASDFEPAFSKNTAFNKSFGTSAGDVCEGNDARLSNARVPSEGWNNAVNFDASGATITDALATTALGRAPRDGDIIRETGGTPKVWMRISDAWYQIA